MKMRTNLNPRQRRRLHLSTGMKWAIAGGSATLLIIIAFLLYNNLGVQHDAKAMPGDNYVINSGMWSDNVTWSAGHPPVGGDIAIIDSGKTVTVASILTFNGTIKVYGTLRFTNGKLTMDSTSSIQVHENGTIISNGPGNSDKITIGNHIWQGNGINQISSPNHLTFSGTIGGNPLPITLEYFKGEPSGNAVTLTWATAMEKDNDFFTIERSSEGRNYTAVGEMPGAGNSEGRLEYIFTDESPIKGMSYYRLKQTDFNGDFTYSPLIQIKTIAEDAELRIITAGPNPFRENIGLEFMSDSDGAAEIAIVDMQGKIVSRNNYNAVKGSNKYTFQLEENLPGGIYFLQVSNNNSRSEVYKIIKQ